MLTVTIPSRTYWDERIEEFVDTSEATIQIEHSLAAMAKWEGMYEKPFLNQRQGMPFLEFCEYVRCMTLNDDEVPDKRVYYSLSQENVKQIHDYIEKPMTATTFTENKQRKPSRQVVTAEILYSQMTMLQIPFECQYWHLNRLMTLIHVCAIAQDPKGGKTGKMKQRDVLAQQAKLNAMRRAKMGTKG